MFENSETQLNYLIKVNQSQADSLAEALNAAGIIFDPVENLIAFDFESDMNHPTVNEGGEISSLINGINQYLEANGLHPKVPLNQDEWSILQINNFLCAATELFDWDGYEVTKRLWLDAETDWSQLAEKRFGITQDKHSRG